MKIFFRLAILMTTAGLAAPSASPPLAYPAVTRGQVVENYHGRSVPDPYRWLESLNSAPVAQFVTAQNALTLPYLQSLPQRAWIKEELGRLWNYERFGVPRKEGGRYFFLRNDGTQNQSVLHVTDSIAGPSRVLLDPNVVRGDATVALSRYVPSPDGKLLAYALSDAGTDWEIWRFRNVDSGADLPEELRFTKFWSVSWSRDSKSVYYSRYPRNSQSAASDKGDDHAQPAVYRHVIGTLQAADRRIYAVRDHRTRVPSADVTDDGRYLIIRLNDGYAANGIRLIDLHKWRRRAIELFADWDALYSVIGTDAATFYVLTTQGAPRGRIIAVDVRAPQRARWRTVVAESDMTISEASLIGGRIVANYVKDAHGLVRIYRNSGDVVGDVALPGLGSVSGFGGHADDPETFFSFTDYLQPTQIFHYDVATNQAIPYKRASLPVDTSRYVTEQVFYTSRDGTRVPMFITHRRDLPRDGEQPTLLYGYGGFGVSATPTFRTQMLVWLEMGGVFAEANLRGGGEYGEAWHVAGTRELKQNVFDDFIAAAQYLIRERWTNPKKLAIQGRSNGGLLVGAVLTQRPELFGAALPTVGVHDILRYHTASANARQWSSDYGLSENAADFAAQVKYSPVQNTRAGTCYPATLVTTADHDDRVVPWHSYKFAAALQHDQSCSNPVLIRIETRAGHGAGKPVWMQIDDFADQWAFVAQALSMQIPVLRP